MTKTKQSKEPIVLCREGSTEPYGVVCGECQSSMWPLRAFGGGPGALEEVKRIARQCCVPDPCECGAEKRRGWIYCDACLRRRDREKVHAAFAKAKKVPLAEYDGEMVTDGNDWFEAPSDVDADTDHALVLDDGTRFVWGTQPERPDVDLERECVDHWLEEHHEDAVDWVDFAKLREAQKLVDEALADVVSYFEDRSVAIILPPRGEGDEDDGPRGPLARELGGEA